VLLALLGLGFGLLQMMTHPESSQAMLAMDSAATATANAGTTMNAAAIGPSVSLPTTSSALLTPPVRQIQASARVLDPNYTVEAGDTLGRIAVRFNTTVDRIQALNNLPDPRTLRIGTQLVIPPAL
jgi:LysM repeat protein